VRGAEKKDRVSIQARPSGRAADNEDFGERPAVDVVAGRAVNRLETGGDELPYQKPVQGQPDGRCTVCGSPANILKTEFKVGTVVDCSRCGDFQVDHVVADELGLPLQVEKERALASHLIRRLQKRGRAVLNREFFASLARQSLPTPAELCDNFLLWVAGQMDGRIGRIVGTDREISDPDILAEIGAIDAGAARWAAMALKDAKLVDLEFIGATNQFRTGLTPPGWNRIEELQRAHVASRFAFFARKFANADLDRVFTECLQAAVKQTGYDLRTVTQKAGHIDAIIEDEIRRCRFLIADLSDDNAGAYWEAGFAEGLGKPVIYVCRDGVKTHFDTDHRQTVRWDLAKLSETAARLKAVIRNTLLGDANQDD
jgi:hypothetical protein